MPCTINHNKSYTDCPECGRLQWHCWSCGDHHACNCTDTRKDERTGPPHFAGETDTEIMPDGSTYRARYSFRVF